MDDFRKLDVMLCVTDFTFYTPTVAFLDELPLPCYIIVWSGMLPLPNELEQTQEALKEFGTPLLNEHRDFNCISIILMLKIDNPPS